MADKISIVSDGTIAGTKIKVDGTDYTSTYKVLSVRFYADGGSEYTSSMSGEKYVSNPSLRYQVTYIDGDKVKNISVSNMDESTEHDPIGVVSAQDAIGFIGIADQEVALKAKMVEHLDKLREKISTIPTKDILEKRSYESIKDKYIDTVKEIEKTTKK